MTKFTEDALRKAVLESKTMSEVFVVLGQRPSGASYRTINKYCSKWKIDTSHFLTPSELAKERWKSGEFKRVPLEEVMVRNSSYSRGSLKYRLFAEGLKERLCEICGQDELWQGKKMSLILDHINGVPNDNRLENLRIVCPNCNATLDTHCGRNKTKQCKRCLIEINTGSICQACKKPPMKRLHKRKVERPSLTVLLAEVKEMGYSATGRKYGVSDNAIRKWLKN